MKGTRWNMGVLAGLRVFFLVSMLAAMYFAVVSERTTLALIFGLLGGPGSVTIRLLTNRATLVEQQQRSTD